MIRQERSDIWVNCACRFEFLNFECFLHVAYDMRIPFSVLSCRIEGKGTSTPCSAFQGLGGLPANWLQRRKLALCRNMGTVWWVCVVWALSLGLVASSSPSLAGMTRVLKAGVAIDSPPISYIDSTGQLRGVAPELASELAKVMGVEILLVPLHKAERREALVRGDIDFLASELLDKRARTDFEAIVFRESRLERRIFVHKSQHTIGEPADFAGKRVLVLRGDDYLRFIPQPDKVTIISVDSPAEAVERLDREEADAFLAPTSRIALNNINRKGLTNLKIVGESLEILQTGMLVRRGDADLHSRLAAALETLDDTGVRRALRKKWSGTEASESFVLRYGGVLLPYAAAVAGLILLIVGWNWSLRRRVAAIRVDLEASERQFKQVIDSSPDRIFVADRTGNVLQSNDPDCPRSLSELFGDSLSIGLLEFLEGVGKRGRSSVAVFQAVSHHGPSRTWEVAASSVDIGANRDVLCCFARDISERKRLENELVQADRLAVIGRMSACVAHEINNPLAIVRSNIALLRAFGVPQESRQFLEAIERNTDRAGKITRELLDLAKPRKLSPGTLDVVELVRECLSFLSPRMRDVSLSMPEPVHPQRLTGDRQLLQQAFINILLNAVESMDGSRQKTLTIRFCDRPNLDYVRVGVEDSGCGIAREMLPMIFEPFVTSGKRSGFGLGLFVVRRIVEDHGGEVYAESELGEGTRMVVELPGCPGAAEDA